MLKKDGIKENCGIFGISCNDFTFSVAQSIYHGLMAIQHRGQLFSGISVYNDGKIFSYKERGLVSKVLNPKILRTFTGNVGIGHVCFGAKRCLNVSDAQPYHFKSDKIEFSMALNGKITNYGDISCRLRDMGRIFTSNAEIELIAILIETFSKFTDNMIATLQMVAKTLKGVYSIIVLKNDGNLYAMRDPSGCKPLCYGTLENQDRTFKIVSSESCAIDALGGKLKGDIEPGEIVEINPISGLKRHDTELIRKPSYCLFEFIYFARPDSILEGISVEDVRHKLGINLARNDNIDAENKIVIPIPDSGRSAAMGYAFESKIPYEEGLMKNRYLWDLKSDVNEKLNPIKPIVKGKDIVLIDDSMLSGVTMKKIISMLRKVGAKTVHVRISAPPIINNCEYNDSFSNRNLLIAYQEKLKSQENFIEEIRKYLGADSLKFQTFEGLINAIGLDESNLCFDCVKDKVLNNEERESPKIRILV